MRVWTLFMPTYAFCHRTLSTCPQLTQTECCTTQPPSRGETLPPKHGKEECDEAPRTLIAANSDRQVTWARHVYPDSLQKQGTCIPYLGVIERVTYWLLSLPVPHCNARRVCFYHTQAGAQCLQSHTQCVTDKSPTVCHAVDPSRVRWCFHVTSSK